MEVVDLGLASRPSSQARATLAADASKLGYGIITWHQVVHGRLGNEHKQALRLPAAAPPQAPLAKRAKLSGGASPLRQLSRLTLHVENVSQLQGVDETNPILASYDMVAIVPYTADALLRCAQAPVAPAIDIVRVPMDQRVPYVLSAGNMRKVAKAGIAVEIPYGRALLDSSARRHLIANAAQVVRACPRDSIVIVSDVEEDAHLRAPADVMHLASVFGLGLEEAMAAQRGNARAVVRRAEERAARRRTSGTRTLVTT